MEIIKAPARQYAFTLRRTNLKKGLPTEDDYFNHLEKWSRLGLCIVIDSVFESTAGLHMHGILEIPKKQNLKVFRVRGWNIKLEELYNEDGWRFYMLKDQKCREDIEEIDDDDPIPKLTKSLFRPKY